MPIPSLDPSEPGATARTEEATIETPELLADRFAKLSALPEGTLADMTTKLEAYQAALTELSPRRTVIRMKPGVDWKAEWRCQHPELAAARDDRFRLEKLVREKRYAEYLASRE